MLDFFSQKNRILLREMVKTDFKLRYQGSLIGHLWSILKPLMLFTIMYLVFVRFLRFDDGTPHYAIGLLIGMVTWSFFSEATSMGMMSIVSRGDLLRKLNFSKEIIVISSVVGASINYIINLLVVFVFALVNGVNFSLGWLTVIPLFAELFLFSAGIAFVLATLFVKYRGMYATPIIYSLTFILQRGQVKIAKLMMLNPLAQIIQDLRHFIVFSGSLRGWDLIGHKAIAIIPYFLPLVIFAIGYYIFHHQAKKFAEIL